LTARGEWGDKFIAAASQPAKFNSIHLTMFVWPFDAVPRKES